MKSANRNFKPFFKTACRCLFALAVAGAFVLPMLPARAATFPGTAYLNASDPTGALSWKTGSAAMTVECWFKISIPSGTNLTDNMTILVNRNNGAQTDLHGYLIFFNYFTGNVEYSCRGASGIYTNTLITRPYLERWYQVAVVRQNDVFTAYVDGRQVFNGSAIVGDSSNTGSMCVGGWGASKYLFGEVQEVSIYQRALSGAEIVDNLFADQSAQPNLTGYFKLGYSTNAANQLTNSAPSPASGIASLSAIGPVTFEQTDEAGEQSTYDSRRNGGRDAIVPLSGSFSWEQTAFARPTPGIAFDFHFGYSSANTFGGYQLGSTDPYASGALGPGWRNTFETRLLPGQSFDPSQSDLVVGLMNWNGSIDTWDIQIIDTNLLIYGTNYLTRTKEYHGELVKRDDLGVFQWTTPDRLIYTFRHPLNSPQVMKGRLLKIQDFNGNTVQLQWNQSIGVLTQVVDSVSGTYRFNYNAGYSLTNVTFGQWQVNFAYDTTNRLISKTLANTSGLYAAVNTTWQFQYGANGLLARIIDPRGNPNLFVQYDQYGRQTNQMDALNRATVTRYGVPGNRQITRIDGETNSWIETYDRKGHILAQQDPLTNITSYAYDANGNRISVTEPLGWQTTYGFDSRANAIARTNALGEVSHWTIHPFFNKAINDIDPSGWTNFYTLDNNTGNLLAQSDALGTLVSYTYRTNGLVDTATDANGRLTRFDYNTNGFLISKIDPSTNTWTYNYNDVGWKLSEVNPLGEVSSYSYNLNGNVIQAIDPLFRHFTKSYDASGNLLSESDGKGQLTTYNYDAANQRTNMVDRAGTNKWTFTYTLRGKLASTIDPQNNTVTQTYDPANRLVSATDPLGNAVTNLYDANGNQILLIDKIGQRWTKTFDPLNRVVAESDPQGDTRQTSYDQVGRIKVVTMPNGYPSTHTYDGRGRLVKWVDAENFQWLYDYDGNAKITNITDALNGHYVMTYGPRNERLTELNQDTNQWAYAYDELLRLKQQTDPNGTTRSLDYDAGGRLLTVQFNTGRRNTLTYDDNNNPRTITRRVGTISTTTQLNYDTLDRVTEETDTFQQTVRYGYDSLGRITTLTYPDGKVLTQKFDPLGRLIKQVDWAARQMKYTYDKAGRLLTRAYPNGVIQTNTFDSAGRITGLSYSPSTINPNSINLALTYAYDRNGNKTGGGEMGTFAWPLPSVVDESSHFTPAGRITGRVDALNATNNFAYQFDKSGNMTNAVMASGGITAQSWALTYDEDNRTTSIHWQVLPLTDKLITNRYDALGRRVSRTLDGVETRYALDLQGSMERILCDTDAGGNITAWYVHGPDLCYKVNATNGLTCYHADAQANIIALTDGNANLVAQYAYTTYGRSLGSTNFQSNISNPYLFVGSQGVMEELPGLYFMRARYFSADAGVFLSTDPVKKIGPGWKPEPYAYGYGNPLTYRDPNGEYAQAVLGAAVGMVVGFTSEVVHQGINAVTGGGFDWDEVVTSTAAEGLGGLEAGLTGSLAAGGAMSEWYRGYIRATSNGESYSLKQGIVDAAGGALESYTFDKFGPKVSLTGGNYFHSVPGVEPSTLTGAFSGSHFLNGLVQDTFDLFRKVTTTVLGNTSMSSRTAAVAAPKASGMTAATSTNPSGASSGGGGSPTTTYTVRAGDTLGNIGSRYGSTATAIGQANGIQNLNVIHPGQVLTIPHR